MTSENQYDSRFPNPLANSQKKTEAKSQIIGVYGLEVALRLFLKLIILLAYFYFLSSTPAWWETRPGIKLSAKECF